MAARTVFIHTVGIFQSPFLPPGDHAFTAQSFKTPVHIARSFFVANIQTQEQG